MSRTTLTMAQGTPVVPRWTVIELTGGSGAGKKFVVVRRTPTTLTLTPFRWWHRVPWLTVLAFLIGVGAGRLLYLWLESA